MKKAANKKVKEDPKLIRARKEKLKAEMDRRKKAPAKMVKKAPMKKALIGKQANLPKELRDKILASPGKMLKPAAMKMMKKAPAKMMKKAPAKMMKKKK